MTIDIQKLEAYLINFSTRNVEYSLKDAKRSVQYYARNVEYYAEQEESEGPVDFKALAQLFPGITRKQEADVRRRLASRLKDRRENLELSLAGLAKAEAKLAVLQQFKSGDLLPCEAEVLAEAKTFNRLLDAWIALKAAQKAAEAEATDPHELGTIRAKFKEKFKEARLFYNLRPAKSHLTWRTRFALKCMDRNA